jgi:hypothetical protein
MIPSAEAPGACHGALADPGAIVPNNWKRFMQARAHHIDLRFTQ